MDAIQGLHHYAYRCRDAEETRKFYEDLLGLPLVHVLYNEAVPSTREKTPHVHIFFQMPDKSFLAFFDLGDNVAPEPSPNTPAWVNHLALRVDGVNKVQDAKERLTAAGIEVLGITDHGFVQSIYFFDPNGIRLELTAETATEDEAKSYRDEAHGNLNAWIERKAKLIVDKNAAG